ncbi:MAG: sialidase family protein [Gemmataceae bacterium]
MHRKLWCLVILLGSSATLHADPEKIDLFEAGQGGYALYRIPGIVTTAKGTVLAYCEARKNGASDWGVIDLMVRRSTNGGKTWDAAKLLPQPEGPFPRNPIAVKRKIGKDGEVTFNNAVMIAEKSGPVHLLFCVQYGRCFHCRSDDDGRTFGKPVEITDAIAPLKKTYPWQVVATGPGHGIELKNGRLLVPIWLSTGETGAHRPSVVSTLYCDDSGKTWNVGEIVAKHPDLANPSETVAVELGDGSVMLNIRNEAKERRRAVAIGKDGATGWSKPQFDDALIDPVCMGSILRLGPPEKKQILFANPNDAKARKNLTLRLSNDDGKTWPASVAIEPGPSAYSDLALAADGTILCFYERESADDKGTRRRLLTVARIQRGELK